MTIAASRTLFAPATILCLALTLTTQAFQPVPTPSFATRQEIHHSNVICSAVSRRDLLSAIVPTAAAAILIPSSSAVAADGDLTQQLFNADGSLKEGVESEIKFRKVDIGWDPSDDLSLNRDGANIGPTKSGSKLRISYEYPLRWSDGKDGDPIYFDRTEGTNAKACKQITVYQAPGTVDEKQLEKATTIGVAKAIDAPMSDFARLYKADIISGKTSVRGEQKFYEFDMASAPDACGNSKENLGLGFCPYDNIYLLSATVVNDKLYCIVVECDDTRVWKLDSAELKRVRSSFKIEEVS